MTISIDDRAGSAQIAPILRRRGVPVELTRMEYGDAAFIGAGVDGSPVTIGIEVKGVDDVMKCITDGRFAGHQLPGLVQSYDLVWLLIIGVIRPRPRDGVLEYQMQRGKGAGYWREVSVGRRAFMWRDLQTWLMTMTLKAGIRVAVVDDYDTAAIWLGTLYSWWRRGWDEHESHLAMHDAMRDQLFDRALLVRPSLARCFAAQLPGIGRAKSADVSRRFKSVMEMVLASEKDWQDVPGVGKGLSKKVYAALRGNVTNGNGH